MSFGQLVVGPPGSGKTTFCNGMSQYLESNKRSVAIVNLDPANDRVPYEAAVDVMELITVEDVMENFTLGPNGALMYCMEYLEKNLEWLDAKLDEHKGKYLLFDCPGQVELYTHHTSMGMIVQHLAKRHSIRLAAVHLVDSHYCNDPGKFIAIVMTSLSAMLRLELPHINVLSKVDLLKQMSKLAFNLSMYTDVDQPQRLLAWLQDDPLTKKFKRLNEKICSLIEDYSLVMFSTLDVENKEMMSKLAKAIDKANGYIYGGLEEGNESIMAAAVGATFNYARAMEINDDLGLDEDDEDQYEFGDEDGYNNEDDEYGSLRQLPPEVLTAPSGS